MDVMIENAYLPTLADLLKLPVFNDAHILSDAGTEHPVGGVFLSEIPDYDDWVTENELVVTNCYALYNRPELLRSFVPRLSELGVAGVCIKPDRFLGGVVPADMVASARHLGFPLIELPAGIRFSEITKAVTDELLRRQTAALRSSLAVGELLTRTIAEGATLEEIVGTVREITGRSVLILDAINHRQAAALNLIDTRRWPQPESPDFFKEVFQEADRYEIETAGNTFGALFLFGERNGPELQRELLEQILLAIPLEITRFHLVHQDEEKAFRDFFFHLLSDQVKDDAVEQERAKSLGFRLSDRHMILAVRMRKDESANLHGMLFHRTVFHRAVREIIGNSVESVRYIENGGDTLVLLSSADTDFFFSQLPKKLCSTLTSYLAEHTEMSVAVGCSRPHAGISGLISCSKEADLALRAAASRRESKALRFDDLGILSLLYANDPNQEVTAFVKDVLKELIDPTFPKGAELLETLGSYFRHLGNQRKMGEELYIHYNTVAYRLKQIQEITGKRFSDPEDRMLLELALYLYRFFQP
jgi:purine catabolism regulator